MRTPLLIWLAALAFAGRNANAQTATSPAPAALKQADRLFKDQHWAEARAAYETVRDRQKDWHAPDMRRAMEGTVTCSFKLAQWDEATRYAEDYIAHNRDTLDEATGQRVLAALYVAMLHDGIRRGDRFVRGEGGPYPGTDVRDRDHQEAIRHLERARDLLARLAARAPDTDPAPVAERPRLEREWIGIDFDLASVLVRRIGDLGGSGSTDGWNVPNLPDEDADSEAGNDEAKPDTTEWRDRDEPPAGLPLRPDGTPRFPTTPPAYTVTLDTREKIRFLLAEVARLDTSAHGDDAAKAVFRQAMVARQFYGPQIARNWLEWWQRYHAYHLPTPPGSPSPATPVWELRDDQTICPVGVRLEVVDLPADESPLALLQAVEARYPQSAVVPEARFARALYYQSRQQFPQALAEYRAFLEQFPKHRHADEARRQIASIREPAVAVGRAGVQLAGEHPRLSWSVRNAGAVEFTVRRFDLRRYTAESARESEDNPSLLWNLGEDLFKTKGWQRYFGKEPVAWTEAVPPGQDGREFEGSTLVPLTDPGVYLVEARVAGKQAPTRLFVLIEDTLLLRKTVRDGVSLSDLLVACDARTGQPLRDRAVRVYEQWEEPRNAEGDPGKTHTDHQTLITDADGAIAYRHHHPGHFLSIKAALMGEDGRLGVYDNSKGAYGQGDENPANKDVRGAYLVTDRPVYRPGATVRFCLWLREKHEGVYRFPPPGPVEVRILDPDGRPVQALTLQLDALGVASGEWTLGAQPPLGTYGFAVGSPTKSGQSPNLSDHWPTDGAFRVEEYRQPEFEVSVRPSATQSRLGEKFKATVEARYYFGAPVAGAKTSYKVFREVYQPVYFEPGEYDWLYGKGYGLVFYPYPWLSWWERWGGQIGWGGDHPSRPPDKYTNLGPRLKARELVAQGEAGLNADGKYELEVDTVRGKAEQGSQDYQYTVEATVRGASRRAVEGQGSIVVTRQEFYAYVETEHGWYSAGNEARVQIRTLTPGNVPVTAKGQVVVSRVRYDGANHDEPTEEAEQRWDAETGSDGRLEFSCPLPREGQYHVEFHAEDSWRQEVRGNAVFWVSGPKFDGRSYRFHALEIISDKRSYRVGETAHLLVNTAGDNAHLLFAEHAEYPAISKYHFLDVTDRSTVIDVPIDESCVPNFFVEATTVRDGRVHTESCELIVPPERGLLKVKVQTDKPAYLPGETGTVHIEVTDREGNPVTGQVTLTAFDKAVTAIQAEAAQGPGEFFHGQRREYETLVDLSFEREDNPDKPALGQPQGFVLRAGTLEGWEGSWKMGAGQRPTPFWRMIRSQGEGAGPGRIVVTGSSILTLPGFTPPRPGADEVDAMVSTSATRTTAPGVFSVAGVFINPARTRGGGPAVRPVEPEIRTQFADTALWLPALILDAKGTAEATITFPQSLTTWRVHGYAINAATQVGDAATEAATTKKLLVRLLSPRFFTERDEVVLSAAVNNDLPDAQDVTAELILPATQFQWTGGASDAPPAPDADGNVHLTATANVASNAEHRFDWPVRVLRPGLATITARALTEQESDGMRLAFPVQVHGADKTLVQSGSLRVGQDGDRTLHLEIPAEIDPEKTQLEITLSPSLAGVMIDALPFLADYPYGCVEQTMSRFYPSVLVRDTLKRMGTDLETLGNQRRQMNVAGLSQRYGQSPIYDSIRLDRMIREGLASLYDFQCDDGGWGWWHEGVSSPFQTAYVLQGLQAAKAAGVAVDEGVYTRGFDYLRRVVQIELAKPARKQEIGSVQEQAYLAYILSLEPAPEYHAGETRAWLDRLYAGRGELNNYGRALLALALHLADRDAQAHTVLRNLLQFVERDDSNETAWVRTPNPGWWHWWNNDIETNAWALKALVALEPHNDLAPRLVKWLLNNRRGGSYWRSTRDTAQVIAAMTDYLLASGEGAPDEALAVSVDGQTVREAHVTRENLFAFDNRVLLQGLQLKPGSHEVMIHKQGAGALYYSCRLTYFTREEGIKSAGNEIAVERTYARLVPKATAGQPASGVRRVPLKDGDELNTGDEIEVALRITAKNTYDYLAFEDMKPAGCEPVEVRSGGRWAGGFCANVEVRDTKTVFFVSLLEQGEHWLRYRLRAETPGKFHALPANGAAMYAPEVRANSDEMRMQIRD